MKKTRKENEDDQKRVNWIIVRYSASWLARSVVWPVGFVGLVWFCWLVGLLACGLIVENVFKA